MAARHEEIAEELRRAIDREDYSAGSCSRGDLTRRPLRRLARHGLPAVAALTAEGQIGSHQGARREALTGCRSQSFTEPGTHQR